MQKLTDSLNRFSFETLKKTNTPSNTENIIFSPYSAFACVSMSSPLFLEQTRVEILKSLQISSEISQNFESFLHQLRNLIEKENTDKVSSSNRIWANERLNFSPETFSLNKDILGIPIEKVDFPQPGCDMINEEVNKVTRGMIPKLVEPSDLSPQTAMTLLNAIYFKCDWEKKFEIDPTSKSPSKLNFTLANGTKVHTTMLYSGERKVPYTENEKFKVISIPYLHNQYEFIIILPKSNSIEGYNELISLQYDDFNTNLLSRLQKQKVNIRIPKFTIESKLKLNPIFKELGMNKAFTDFAECTDKNVKYKVDLIIQKAKIIVDENGTEAAAATGMTMRLLSIDVETVYDFFANHPFAFFLRNKETGTILFEGFVKNPQ